MLHDWHFIFGIIQISTLTAGPPSRATRAVRLWAREKATKTAGHTLHLSCQEVSSQVNSLQNSNLVLITSCRSKRIDIVARIIFPIIFATFNLCYWTFYLSEEHKSLRQATKWSQATKKPQLKEDRDSRMFSSKEIRVSNLGNGSIKKWHFIKRKII